VFDKWQPSTAQQRPFVFTRMGKGKIPKPSVFQILQERKQSKPSIFTRIKIGGKSSNLSPAQDKNFVFSSLGEVNEIQSLVLSRMKHIFTLDAKTDGSLKVKRCTLVITNCEASWNSKEKIKGDGQASLHPVTIQETNDLDDDTKLVEALETSENTEGFHLAPSTASSSSVTPLRKQMLKHAPKYEPNCSSYK